MNIALVLQHKLLLGIQRFMHSGPSPVTRPALRPIARPVPSSLRSHTRPPVMRTAKTMPLRVLHEVEAGMPRSSAGRMVISGRMADVCAELDRLVAREAAMQTLH